MTSEKWFVTSNGEGAFNACFQTVRNNNVIDEGVALKGVSQREAVFHVERAQRSVELRERNMALCNHLFDEGNWKLETKRELIADAGKASAVTDALGFFCGGAEMLRVNGGYSVGSRGYYHYCGA